MFEWLINNFKAVKPRCTFYDDVHIDDSFRCKPILGSLEDVYHIKGLTSEEVTYVHKVYGYAMDSPKTISKVDFKILVKGGRHCEGFRMGVYIG